VDVVTISERGDGGLQFLDGALTGRALETVHSKPQQAVNDHPLVRLDPQVAISGGAVEEAVPHGFVYAKITRAVQI